MYYLALAGFDTHVRQPEQQQRLFTDLGDGLAALADDLQKNEQWVSTLVLVFSEFGRCVDQNASNGTDHGTANTVFLLGGALQKKGVLNAAPDIANPDQSDLRHRVDFRAIYAAVLKNWLGADDATILGTGFERLQGLVQRFRSRKWPHILMNAPYSGTLNPKAQMACSDPKTWVARPCRSSPR